MVERSGGESGKSAIEHVGWKVGPEWVLPGVAGKGCSIPGYCVDTYRPWVHEPYGRKNIPDREKDKHKSFIVSVETTIVDKWEIYLRKNVILNWGEKSITSLDNKNKTTDILHEIFPETSGA